MANPPPNSDISTDILILSNAPGELTTWVYPFLKALEISLQSQENPRTKETRISVVLSPCQNASGNEAELVKTFPNVDRVLPQSQFWDFLLWGRTPNWQWSKQGIVIFFRWRSIFYVSDRQATRLQNPNLCGMASPMVSLDRFICSPK